MSNESDPVIEGVEPSVRRWWYLDPTGSAVGLLLAILSVTPSLLPRPALFQGAIAAVAFAVGYLAGVLLWQAVRSLVNNYGDVVTTGWLEVTGDAGLDPAAVDRIREVIEAYAPIPPYAE